MIKRIILTIGFMFGLVCILVANPTKYTLVYDGHEREYMLFVPDGNEKPHGIIVCLHGFNSKMEVFFDSYDLSGIASQMNYIILAPQALPELRAEVIAMAQILSDSGFEVRLDAAWGCGVRVATTILFAPVTIQLNKDIDDPGFIKELIRLTTEAYQPQTSDVFALGTSLGGYMAYQMALSYGNELSGIISIAGSMGLAIREKDNDVKLPICDFHSLTDEVVPYNGELKMKEGIISLTVQLAEPKADVIDFWVKKNGITASPITETVDYYPSSNGITAEKIIYPDAENEVIHYRTNGAPHEYFFRVENGDCMDMREEVAKFILAHESLPPILWEIPTYADGIKPIHRILYRECEFTPPYVN